MKVVTFSVLSALLVTAACQPEDTYIDSMEPSIEDIQVFVFDEVCATSGCHDAETAGGELDLSTVDASYDGLVDVPAVNSVAAANGWRLVLPGEPDLSFLVRKMEEPGLGEGAPMPLDGTEVTEFYMNAIREWIAMGAPR